MHGSKIQRFTDPEEYQHFTPNAQRKIVVAAPGRYEAEAAKINLHRLLIERAWQSLPTVSFSAICGHRITVCWQPTSNSTFGGVEVYAGDIIVRSPDSEHFSRTAANMRWESLSLAEDDFAVFAQSLTGRELRSPQWSYVMRPPPASMSRLVSLHKAVSNLAATVPDVIIHPEVAKAIEQEILRAMVACLTARTKEERIRPLMQSVVRRFEEMINACPDQPIYVAEVCAALGITERTLRNYCQAHLGMAPHRYLWLRRMHLARRALVLADGTAKTVTQIANDHGFGELGRFAVAYRRLFLEAPSATLRRPRDMARDALPDGNAEA